MTNVVCESIGTRVGVLMRDRGLSQKELAGLVGVTEAAMSRYLKNDREPKIDVVAKLARALHTTTDFLIYGDVQESEFEEVYRAINSCTKDLDDKQRLALMKLLL